MGLRDLIRIHDVRNPRERWKITAYEMAFRALCRHRQGDKPNVLMYCTRRGGSTWLLNTMAAHPGCRSVGRPFLVALHSRWRHLIPDLAEAAGYEGDHDFEIFVHFEGDAERRWREFAGDVVEGRTTLNPTLHFGAPYFNRVTDRVVFQMTNETALIEWFDRHFDVATMLLIRHPVSNALSIMDKGWRHEVWDFLHHRWFVDTQLTGPQVDLARRVAGGGDELAKHVLDWSLKMLAPVRAAASGAHPDWLTLTYEETVLAPEQAVGLISEHLDFPDRAAMEAQVRLPSRNVSDPTRARVDDPDYVLRRWRRDIGPEREQELLAIPHGFGIDLYRPGEDLAKAEWLHHPRPAG